MKRKIDRVGRIVIPSDMRDELKLEKNGFANIEIKNKKIIINNLNEADFKTSLENIIKENEEIGYINIDELKKLL